MGSVIVKATVSSLCIFEIFSFFYLYILNPIIIPFMTQITMVTATLKTMNMCSYDETGLRACAKAAQGNDTKVSDLRCLYITEETRPITIRNNLLDSYFRFFITRVHDNFKYLF